MRTERILGTVIYWFKVNEETIGKETVFSVNNKDNRKSSQVFHIC